VLLAQGPGIWTLRNATGTASVWLDVGIPAGIDAGTVTTSTGFEWQATDPLIVAKLAIDTALFAIANTPQVVHAIKGVRFVSSDVLVVS